MGGQRADRSAEWFFSVLKPYGSRLIGKFGKAKRLAINSNNMNRAIHHETGRILVDNRFAITYSI